MKGALRLLAACVLGTLLGLTNSLANVVGGPYAPHPLRPEGVWGLQLLGAVLGTTWAWAAGAFGCGWLALRWWHAPFLGVLGLWCADVAYYVSDWLGDVNSDLAVNEIVTWAGMGLAAGLVMGLLAGLTRRRARWSLLPALAAFAALWRLRQMSGAEVVSAASHQTQTVLTIIAIVVVVTVWWIVGQVHQRPHPN